MVHGSKPDDDTIRAPTRRSTARDIAATTRDVATEVADRASAVAARLPEAAATTRGAVEEAARRMEAGSDEMLAVGASLSLGLAIGMLDRRREPDPRRPRADPGDRDGLHAPRPLQRWALRRTPLELTPRYSPAANAAATSVQPGGGRNLPVRGRTARTNVPRAWQIEVAAFRLRQSSRGLGSPPDPELAHDFARATRETAVRGRYAESPNCQLSAARCGGRELRSTRSTRSSPSAQKAMRALTSDDRGDPCATEDAMVRDPVARPQ